ncbi:MAG TPA: hypothetical protein PLM08_14110, partial [Polyangiaceae bacterium]|nr:hypothetical protein [Polyangiaceae bacterium]
GGPTEPIENCGDFGPRPEGTTCVMDPTSHQYACGTTCNEQLPCAVGVCDPSLGVCVRPPSKRSNEDSADSDGSCSIGSSPSQHPRWWTFALTAIGAVMWRRRTRVRPGT